MRGLQRAAAWVLLAAVAATADARVLYKWIDAQGKVQYSDQPPKNFTGEVTRIEPDTPATPAPAPRKAVAPVREAKPAEDTIVEMAARKRETRDTLRANVERARAKVEEAKKALQEAQDTPRDEERQIIQQRVSGRGNTGTPQNIANPDKTQSRVTGGGIHGMSARANCRDAKGADGKVATICPSSMLTQDYFERIAKLEEALRKAEDELELAQTAYRRNVD